MISSSSSSSSSSLTLREVPHKPFYNIIFDIHIHLIDDITGKLICGEDIPLNINLLLLNENDTYTNLNEFLKIGSDNICLPRTGSVIFPITITTTSMAHGNGKFVLEIVPIDHPYIKPIRSDPMTVITYELIIEQPPPSLWYKDQGGRDNFIDMRVRLVDHRHMSVTSRRVPLKVTLYYENGVMVPKQDILKVEGEILILERRGEASMRFRIEEVSRSHQRQKFIVRISPDTHLNPRNSDINPVETPPIEVMSKPKGGMMALERREAAISALTSIGSTSGVDISSSILPITHDKSLLPIVPPTSALASSSALLSMSKKRTRESDIKLEFEDNDRKSSYLPNFSSTNKQPTEAIQSIIVGHQKLIEELLKMNQTLLTEYMRYNDHIRPLIQKLQINTIELQNELYTLKRKEQLAAASASTTSSSISSVNNNDNNNNDGDNEFNNIQAPPLNSYHSLMPTLLSYPSLQTISSLPLDLLAEAANELEGRKSISNSNNNLVGSSIGMNSDSNSINKTLSFSGIPEISKSNNNGNIDQR